MKTMGVFLLVVSLLFSTGCTSVKVFTDADETVALSQYKKYAWIPEDKDIISTSKYNTALILQHVQETADGELEKKGYSIDDKNPDFLIHHHLVVEGKSTVINEPEYRYRPSVIVQGVRSRYYVYDRPYLVRNNRRRVSYKEGTLVIDIIDRQKNSLVWRGWIEETIDNNAANLPKIVIENVQEILSKFPAAK